MPWWLTLVSREANLEASVRLHGTRPWHPGNDGAPVETTVSLHGTRRLLKKPGFCSDSTMSSLAKAIDNDEFEFFDPFFSSLRARSLSLDYRGECLYTPKQQLG